MLKNKNNKTLGVVILAAGHGTRMQSELPKVMHVLHGKSLVDHLVTAVEASGIATRIVVVVNPNHDLVQEALGERAEYAVQQEQLGTGHATQAAAAWLGDTVDDVIVLYGDMPFISAESIKALYTEHLAKQNTLTLMSVDLPNFEGTNVPFYGFGRIIRDAENNIIKVVEMKDATEKELQMTEVNPSFFCFNAAWLWKQLALLKNNNVQKEYYLTDLLHQAIDTGVSVSSVFVDADESRGVNSKEDLAIAHTLK
jgi:bifunctional UDP-N-acetylglucosamine pyrophosphorylase / glucosamine-1-phosphate N-acetyltransferase